MGWWYWYVKVSGYEIAHLAGGLISLQVGLYALVDSCTSDGMVGGWYEATSCQV